MQDHLDLNAWRPQSRFRAAIGSKTQLQSFNETGGIAVFIDVAKMQDPDIEIVGSQNRTISFWDTKSRSGFVTKPKFSAGLLTVRFVTSGEVTYLLRGGEMSASSAFATLTGFEDLREVRASSAFGAVSATLSMDAMIVANRALTGHAEQGLPNLEPVAGMEAPGMAALYCSIRAIQRRLEDVDRPEDLLLPLMQEVMSYQLLSAWPRRQVAESPSSEEAASRQLRMAIDFIEANLPRALTLADVAASVGISVRSLQSKFKKELGRTPLQFIIERRLTRVHEELISSADPGASIGDIARSWGFVHIPDFGQRYRRLFHCTPSQTRANARLGSRTRAMA